jgi:hypothetical protein
VGFGKREVDGEEEEEEREREEKGERASERESPMASKEKQLHRQTQHKKIRLV